MQAFDKEVYLADLKLILSRVREASKASQQLGLDLEEFLGGFQASTVD